MNTKDISNTAEIAVEDWLMDGLWPIYKFNFQGSTNPEIGEVNRVDSAIISFRQIDHMLLYLIGKIPSDAPTIAQRFKEPLILLNLSTTNSGHSLSELISFINFYIDNDLHFDIGVSDIIVQKLPYVFGVLSGIINKKNIVILDSSKFYSVDTLIIRRNTHFNSLMNWSDIPYSQEDNILRFYDIQEIARHHRDDPIRVMELSKSIYSENKSKYPLYERVMLAKLRTEKDMTTPGRAMELGDISRRMLEGAGVKILSVADFANTEQYITTLHGAKKVITSYGNVTCTNRFFLNPGAEVLLLANKQYQWEYEHPGAGTAPHWHLRHSHLFPVAKQTVILDHNDVIDSSDVKRIIDIIG